MKKKDILRLALCAAKPSVKYLLVYPQGKPSSLGVRNIISGKENLAEYLIEIFSALCDDTIAFETFEGLEQARIMNDISNLFGIKTHIYELYYLGDTRHAQEIESLDGKLQEV